MPRFLVIFAKFSKEFYPWDSETESSFTWVLSYTFVVGLLARADLGKISLTSLASLKGVIEPAFGVTGDDH